MVQHMRRRATSWRRRPAALIPACLVTVLFVVLTVGVLTGRSGKAASTADAPNSLRALAARAGCELIEVDLGRPTNPPITGTFRERDRVPTATTATRRRHR